MDLEIQETFRSLFVFAINDLWMAIPENYLDFLIEIKESSIITNDQLVNLWYLVTSQFSSLKVARLARLSIYLKANSTFLHFFRYLRVKSENNILIQNYLGTIKSRMLSIC